MSPWLDPTASSTSWNTLRRSPRPRSCVCCVGGAWWYVVVLEAYIGCRRSKFRRTCSCGPIFPSFWLMSTTPSCLRHPERGSWPSGKSCCCSILFSTLDGAVVGGLMNATTFWDCRVPDVPEKWPKTLKWPHFVREVMYSYLYRMYQMPQCRFFLVL